VPEVIEQLVESPDGVRTTFTTPEPFVSGTFRLIRNGSVYRADDDRFGWSETDTSTVELNEAPETGEILQAFFTNLVSCGSPFDPEGTLP